MEGTSTEPVTGPRAIVSSPRPPFTLSNLARYERDMSPSGELSDPIEDSLAEIAFLSTSVNRLAVLLALVEQSHSRHVLAEMTGVSRVTLSRILTDLEARRWITQEGTRAEITELGAWVAEEFVELCEMFQHERSLREVSQWFPEDGFGFHLSALESARIITRNEANPAAPIASIVDELERPRHIRAFSFSITRPWLDTCWRRITGGELRWEWVTTPDVIDVLTSHPDMARQVHEILQTDRATFYTNESVTAVVLLADGGVHIRLVDEERTPAALIQSHDDAVWSWAEETFEAYKADGTRVDRDTFST